jgi:zinc transport system permease protein
VALGYLIGVNPTLMTILVVVVMALILEYLRRVYKDYSEVSMAFLMAGGMAIALILISLNEGGATTSVDQYLFGSIVTISSGQLGLLLLLTVTILLLYAIFKKPMYTLTFDEETAFVQGLPVKLMSNLFTVIVGLVIAMVMPIVGALLVSAILIFPAAISMRLSKSFRGVILIGVGIAMIGMFGGLYLSYTLATPPGATIVTLYIVIFILTHLLQRLYGSTKK